MRRRTRLTVLAILLVSLTTASCSSEQTCDLKGRTNPLVVSLGSAWDTVPDASIHAECDENNCIVGSPPEAREWTATIPDPSTFETIAVQVQDQNSRVLFDQEVEINWKWHEPATACDSRWAEGNVLIESR